MLLSVSTGGLAPLHLREVFYCVAEAGLDGIELLAGLPPTLAAVRRLHKLAADHHVAILSVHQRMITRRAGGVWASWMLEAADLGLQLDARAVVIHGTYSNNWQAPAARRWLRSLEMCQRRLRGSATRLALENDNLHHPRDRHNLLGTPAALAEFANRHDLALTLDTCHAHARDVALDEAWAAMGARTINIHFSDTIPRPLPRTRLLSSLFSDHQFPGCGILPLAEFTAQLKREHYPGILTLEVSPLALPKLSRTRLINALREFAAFGKN